MSFAAATPKRPLLTPLPTLGDVTPEQAKGILNRFVQRLTNTYHQPVSPELYENTLASLETRTPELVPLLSTLHLVASQRRTVDRSDRAILDKAPGYIAECLSHDACNEKVGFALKAAIMGELKPGRALLHEQKRAR